MDLISKHVPASRTPMLLSYAEEQSSHIPMEIIRAHAEECNIYFEMLERTLTASVPKKMSSGDVNGKKLWSMHRDNVDVIASASEIDDAMKSTSFSETMAGTIGRMYAGSCCGQQLMSAC